MGYHSQYGQLLQGSCNAWTDFTIFQVLTEEQHKQAEEANYNFDHPNAFDFDLLYEVLNRLREGKSTEVPVYDFTTHARDSNPKVVM